MVSQPHETGTFRVKRGLAEMLKGGVIMDVVTPDQAKVAEDAGASAVMALERVPADIRRDGGVARMSDPEMIRGIQEAVTIPVMAKARIGHFAEALRRIGEGAAMIRSKGEAGTGDIVEAVRHLRSIRGSIRRLGTMDEMELFGAGGIATPADASLVMQLGAESVFVGSGIFKSEDPERRARAIVEATTHFEDAERLAAASRGLGGAMPGLEIGPLEQNGGLLQHRGW